MVPLGVQKLTRGRHEELRVVSACLRRSRWREPYVQTRGREVSPRRRISFWRVRQDSRKNLEGEARALRGLQVLSPSPDPKTRFFRALDRNTLEWFSGAYMSLRLPPHGSVALSSGSETASGGRRDVSKVLALFLREHVSPVNDLARCHQSTRTTRIHGSPRLLDRVFYRVPL